MKKYCLTIGDVTFPVDLERVIKVKALQLFYKLRAENKSISYKEIYKQVEELFK